MELIKTQEELNEWLKSNYFFADGYLLSVDSDPLSITLGYNVKGNYEANTEREILSFKVTPINLVEWDYVPCDLIPSKDFCIEDIDPLETDEGVGLQSFFQPTFTLIAESFKIEQKIINTTFKPWMNLNEISVSAPMNEIPRPGFWKQKFQELGFDIVFRYYKGEAKQPEQTPYPNYTGYFMQLADKINRTEQGIYVAHVGIEDQEVLIKFSKLDKSLDDVWRNLQIILADIPEVKILCGNCKFTGDQWKKSLEEHFPLVNRI